MSKYNEEEGKITEEIIEEVEDSGGGFVGGISDSLRLDSLYDFLENPQMKEVFINILNTPFKALKVWIDIFTEKNRELNSLWAWVLADGIFLLILSIKFKNPGDSIIVLIIYTVIMCVISEVYGSKILLKFKAFMNDDSNPILSIIKSASGKYDSKDDIDLIHDEIYTEPNENYVDSEDEEVEEETENNNNSSETGDTEEFDEDIYNNEETECQSEHIKEQSINLNTVSEEKQNNDLNSSINSVLDDILGNSHSNLSTEDKDKVESDNEIIYHNRRNSSEVKQYTTPTKPPIPSSELSNNNLSKGIPMPSPITGTIGNIVLPDVPTYSKTSSNEKPDNNAIEPPSLGDEIKIEVGQSKRIRPPVINKEDIDNAEAEHYQATQRPIGTLLGKRPVRETFEIDIMEEDLAINQISQNNRPDLEDYRKALTGINVDNEFDELETSADEDLLSAIESGKTF